MRCYNSHSQQKFISFFSIFTRIFLESSLSPVNYIGLITKFAIDNVGYQEDGNVLLTPVEYISLGIAFI